jgi:hypothetical protein
MTFGRSLIVEPNWRGVAGCSWPCRWGRFGEWVGWQRRGDPAMTVDGVSEGHYDLIDIVSGQYHRLRLPLDAARARRREMGRRLALVPARYRQPALSVEESKELARPILLGRHREYPDVSFEEIELYAYHPMAYTFITFSTKWRVEGRIPGGLLCSIDRADGRVWSAEDFERYSDMNAAE